MRLDEILVSLLSLTGILCTYWFFLSSKPTFKSKTSIPKKSAPKIKKIYPIKGLHCASCVNVTQHALKKTDGVIDATVNLATSKVSITFDPKVCTPELLADSIKKIGYSLEIENKNENILEIENKKNILILKKKLIISLTLGALILWGSFPFLMNFSPFFLQNNWIQFTLALPVQFWCGLDFYKSAIISLRNRTANMDTLVALGTSVAFFYSTFITIFPKIIHTQDITTMTYFDVSTLVIGLILLGRYLESNAKSQASQAIKKLILLQSKTARVIKNNKEINIPVEEIKKGDIIKVLPGEKVPLDGIIINGNSSIDESMLTGESLPVYKTINSNVFSATINQRGTFNFKVTRINTQTLLAQIIEMVEEAQATKAPIQKIADIVSSYFVPIVIMLSFLTFALWYILSQESSTSYALLNTISVLIVACPCAMGLATPMAIIVASGKGAENGILIKNAASLEIANKITTVVFDKTGTLTIGKPEITDIISLKSNYLNSNQEKSKNEQKILQIAASLEKNSEHSLATAILQKAARNNIKTKHVLDFQSIPGAGIQGKIEKNNILFGNKKLMQQNNIDLSKVIKNLKKLEKEGKTVMFLSINHKIIGLIASADIIKPSAIETITSLKNQGKKLAIISGDNKHATQNIADKLGIKNIIAEVLPDQKKHEIEKLRHANQKVAMVGDGINDAPALAASDLSIAIGSGTDIAIEASDITLLNKNLKSINTTFNLSQKTIRTIKQNLFWAFGYNILLIPIAMGILYPFFKIQLNPILSSLAMILSSLSVLTNSLLLKKSRI